MKTYVLGFLLLVCLGTHAQTGKITAMVVNDQQASIENLTVELLKNKDSALIKAAITDKNGIAVFDNTRFGEYRLRVTGVNYTTVYSASFTLSAEQPEITVPKL